jgi:AbrB family looped-hinge helix DNA binding protein
MLLFLCTLSCILQKLRQEIRLRLRKIGNSLLITIPSQVVDDLKLKAGDDMLLDVKDSTIVVRKKK